MPLNQEQLDQIEAFREAVREACEELTNHALRSKLIYGCGFLTGAIVQLETELEKKTVEEAP